MALSLSTPITTSKTAGAVVGALTVLAFTVVHDILISDIWFNVAPMVLAGALAGWSIVWGYETAVSSYSTGSWLRYNGACAGLLLALGGISLLMLEPRFTMAEAMVMSDPLAELLPPAVPLMVGAALVGSGVLWLLFGRHRGAVIPILVTQVLLVFLIGHNLAVLGLVELESEAARAMGEFFGLTIFLAAGFSLGMILWSGIRTRSHLHTPEGDQPVAT